MRLTHSSILRTGFLGQFYWGEDPTKPAGGNATGTAVLVDGQDHWISDIIIFSAAIGIEMTGGAAVISNAHIYNGGGPSLLLRGHAIRVLGCYFDFNPVVIIDPVAVDVSHSFFLGAVGVELRSSGDGAFISGLQITHNQFVVGDTDPTGSVAVWVNESAGRFASINQTEISHNVFPLATYGQSLGRSLLAKRTEATLTAVVKASLPTAATSLAPILNFDFAAALLFDCERFPIATADHSVVLPLAATNLFPRTVLRANCK